MRVFVTGASGFIGKRLVPRLNADGHAVTALLLPAEAEPGWRDVRIARGDISVASSLAGLMEGRGAVIHLAGAVGYGQTFERCNAINRDGTQHVVDEALRAGVRRFVHMSSVSVYGRPVGVVVTEDFPLRKINDPYGDTKIDAERILTALAEAGKLDLTIVRPTVIYGPGDDKFLPKMVENLRAGRATGKPPLLTRYGVRVIGKPYFYSLDRARRELGYQPTIDLREGVRRYFAGG